MKSRLKIRLIKYITEHKSRLCLIVNLIFMVFIVFAFFYFDKSDSTPIFAAAVTDFIICSVILSFGLSGSYGSARLFGLGKRSRESKDMKPILDNITLDLIYNFRLPIIISDSDGYIVWYNEAVTDFLEWDELNIARENDILKKSISSISRNQLSIEKFYDYKYYNSDSSADSPAQPKASKSLKPDKKQIEYINIMIKDKYYRVTHHEIDYESYNMSVFVFFDTTELELMKIESEMKDPVAAYFMIDNLDEATQKMQEKSRIASGEVSDLLNKFIGEYGGVLKEYDKDKYLCFFENRALKRFIKAKFNILDSIREIKIDELNMPVTVSGGVSNIPGSLHEKEAAARHALDLALQRGGDQVVVKNISSIEFFGGKTKTVQKKTKVRSRVTANELAELIKSCSNVLIMGHKFADNDSIGACVGIARFAKYILAQSGMPENGGVNADNINHINADVNIIVNIHDANIKSAFNKLRGFDEYKDVFIDESAALDKITADTLAVAVDVCNPFHFESEAVFKNAHKTAVIDHHRKTVEFTREPDIVYLEPSASSASELVAEILEQSFAPGKLLKEEAELLLAGIYLDTKNFSKNTGTRTFAAAVYLRGEGANPSDALALFKTNVEEFTKEAKFASNTIIYRNMIAISIFEEEASISDKTAGAKAADSMLTIDGVAASFVIYPVNGEVHISARSLGKVNVQLIMEAFGGGGHFEGAGAQIKNSSLREVLVMLKKTIDEYFDVG